MEARFGHSKCDSASKIWSSKLTDHTMLASKILNIEYDINTLYIKVYCFTKSLLYPNKTWLSFKICIRKDKT